METFNFYGIIGNISLWLVIIIGLTAFFVYRFHGQKKQYDERLARIKQDNEFFAEMLNLVSDFVVLVDSNKTVRQINRKVEEYFGRKANFLVGKNIQRLRTNFVLEDHREAMNNNFAYGASYTTEVEFYGSGEEAIPFAVEIFRFTFDEKPYYGVVARDLQKIVERENLLAEQENKLGEMEHIAKLGYWEINHATGEIAWSRELYHILGYEVNKVKPNLDVLFSQVHPDDVGQVSRAFVNALQNQEIVDIRSRIIRVNGEMLDVIIRIRHIFTAKNEHLSTIGLIQDITEMGELQDSLEVTNKFSNLLIENGDFLVLTTSPEGVILNVNPYIEKLTGLSRDELIGQPAKTIFGRMGGRYAKRLDRLKTYDGTLQMKDVDGKVHHILWTTSDFKVKDKVDAKVSIGLDATETINYRVKFEHQATHDPVTDLPNRFKLEDVLARYLERNADNPEKTMSLLFIALTNFNEFNDLYGLEVGDAIVKEVAARLDKDLGQYGLVARFSTDLMAIFVPDARRGGGIEALCQQVLRTTDRPIAIDEYQFVIGAQIGVARFPEDGADRDELLRCAHAAVNRARRDENIGYYIFDRQLKEEMDRSSSDYVI